MTDGPQVAAGDQGNDRRRAMTGVMVSLTSALAWLAFLAANGPAQRNDTRGYLRVADAFSQLRIVSSIRMPGYPLFLVFARALASWFHVDFPTTTGVLQTVLLAGLATGLVFATACRLTGCATIGVLAASLFALDGDVQQFGSAMLTEGLTVTLVVVGAWLRVVDGHWKRAAWPLAVLTLLRPNFIVFPLTFALLDGWRLRSWRATIWPILPTVAVLATWGIVALTAGADPWRPQRWYVPIHTFGKVYEGDLWKGLPDGPERRVLVEQRTHHADAYQAGAALESVVGRGSMVRVTHAAIRANPIGYLRSCIRVIPLEFRWGTWMKISEMNFAHPRPTLLEVAGRFHAVYRGLFYGSFWLFVALLAVACARGFGWPKAATAFREVFGPFVVVLLTSVAWSSCATYDIARLAIAFHPFNAVLWACALGRFAELASAPWWQREPPPRFAEHPVERR